jgi:hypothetical protein
MTWYRDLISRVKSHVTVGTPPIGKMSHLSHARANVERPPRSLSSTLSLPPSPPVRACDDRDAAGLLDWIEATWLPGEWLAVRAADGELFTAKFAGVSVDGAVNIWLADGALQAIRPEAVATDWLPPAAETFEERLGIMIESGAPEADAHDRAAQVTKEYMERVASRPAPGAVLSANATRTPHD